MIHVLIPVHNRLQLTIRCLLSLKKQINYNNLNIIVIDDASTDGTKLSLKSKFPEVTVLNGDGSLFWGGAISYGVEHVIKISKIKDWVLILNNDVELHSNTILLLVNELNKRNRKAIAGALTIDIDDRVSIIKSGTIVKNWFLNNTKHPYEGLKINELKILDPIEVDFITGRCLLHPVEIFRVAGNYDSKTFNHYGGDDEFSMRIKRFGYLSLLCPSSIVFLKKNEPIYKKKINIKNFLFTILNIKSSSNIINKLNLTLKVVPFYAKISFFIIGLLKSIYISLKK